jgi:hypothetical protein
MVRRFTFVAILSTVALACANSSPLADSAAVKVPSNGTESVATPPTNLPKYPCEPPAALEATKGSLDAGAPRDAGGLVNGRLPPEVIQKIVREHFDEYRRCYEAGMRRNPNLSGRVAIKFIIDRSGGVRDSHPMCTSFPDDEVVRCVVEGFERLSFPEPEGGMVTVVYPITFIPGD